MRGTHRNDPEWVDVVVGEVVVTLDVIEVYRLGDARLLVEVAQVSPQMITGTVNRAT